MSDKTIRAVACAVINKMFYREKCRDDLVDGAKHKANLRIIGNVDGKVVDVPVEADVSVGKDFDRAATNTPEHELLVGYLLSQIEPAKRKRTIEKLPQLFGRKGQYPKTPAAIVKAAAQLCEQLRAQKVEPVRGWVSIKYELGQPRKVKL